ncbi:MAG: HAMP domain-containing histidine kinase [Reichenbachiella sp.]
MESRIKYFFLTFILIIPITAWGQKEYTPVIADPLLQERRYALFPELDNQGIRCIASDPRSDLYWFGIQSGLASYDGFNWEFYGSDDGIDAPIDQILISRSKTVYAVNKNGLLKNQDGKWTQIFKMPSGLDLFPEQIIELMSGNIAVCSQIGLILTDFDKNYLLTTQGDWSLNPGYDSVFEFVEIPVENLSGGVYTSSTDVLEFSEGNIWVAMNGRDDKGEILMIHEQDILNQNIVEVNSLSAYFDLKLGDEQTIFKSSKEDIWVINHSNRVPAAKYSNGKWEYVYFGNQSNTDYYAENIVETPDSKIWISGLSQIFAMDTIGQWTKYNTENSSIKDIHINMHVGNYSDLWISGNKSNVYRIDLSQDKWIGYRGLNFQCETSDETLWFLEVEGNVVNSNNNDWRIIDKKIIGIDNAVSIYKASEDVIWVVGSDKGNAAVSYFKNGSWHQIVLNTLSWGVDYRAIFESKEGEIWIGASADINNSKNQFGGVVQIQNPYAHDRKIFHHKPFNSNGLGKTNLYGISQSKDGRIWTGGSLLSYWSNDQWHKMKDENLYDYVNDVYNDPNGVLYVGSRHHGLYVMKDDNWVNFTMDNDLNNNNIISISTNNKGDEIWLATIKGFSYFNGDFWINDIFPEEMTLAHEGGTIIHNNDGIWVSNSPREWKRRVFSGEIPSQSIKDRYGTYRFVKGTLAPDTQVDTYTELVSNQGNAVVYWSGKLFFNMTNNDQLLFSYKMDNNDWSAYSQENSHTFLSLKDGEHTFSVRAMDKVGNVDLTPASVVFSVAPPVWKEVWFILMVISFVLIIIYYQIQIHRKREKLERSNISLYKKSNELVKALDQLKHAQTKLVKNEKMATLGMLSAGVAHEINNPLNFIKGGIDALIELMKKNGDIDDTTTRLVSAINEGVRRANEIVKSLGKLSRQNEANTDLCDLHSILDDCVLILHGLIKNKIEIEKSYTDHEILIIGNEGRLHQAFLNILANSKQAIVDQGKICIDTTIEGGDTQIRISDTGMGISKESMSRIGEPFFTTKDSEHGTGLGMAITISIIEEHNGNLEIESELGKGTTIIINLPRKINE